MGNLSRMIENSILSHISQLNTIMLCEIVSQTPLKIQPVFNQQYMDGDSQMRTIIENPFNMDKKIYNVGDIVVVAILQEYTEGGATRKFDLTDAVILGQANKSGQYSGKVQFAKYANKAEKAQKSITSQTSGIVGEVEMKPIPELKGSNGESEDWGP